MDAPLDAVNEEPRGALGSFDRLLTNPQSLSDGRLSTSGWLLAGALVGFALYGAIAGLFQGGNQVLIAALKAPLIVGLALLLCLPSLYVFSALSGARWSKRRLLSTISGFAATLGLLLAALLPISWLFSVSSRYLASAVWIHLMLWVISLLVGWRFLSRALRESGAGGGMFLWLLLFAVVSLQVATFLRPVLWREPKQPLFESGKMFFGEHFGKVVEHDEGMEKAEAKKRQKPAAAKKGSEPKAQPATAGETTAAPPPAASPPPKR
ncbi:MAG TPA: hypothetical protein VE078_10405 [Thermoanaerobaculia bacterium]|nr:hypothetical protein [Thermoanaerobaculia bacterium]